MIESQDIAAIGLLVFLEGVLSLDNALVLALMVRHLPARQQKRALTYGMAGAFFFRFLALSFLTYLMHWTWIKFVGGGYLLFLSVHHFVKKNETQNSNVKTKGASFWKTILLVELTDIAFAVDSILASVAVSKKFYVIFIGGLLGIIMMRVAASLFGKLLDRFPKFERTAYLLILVIGLKLIVDGLHLPSVDFHSSESPAFWIFWSLMAIGIISGFQTSKREKKFSR